MVEKLFFIVVIVGVPSFAFLYAIVKKSTLTFGLGVCAFVGSQMLFRIPLLQLLAAQSSSYQLATVTAPLVIFLFLAFTAGIVEELARWLMMRMFLKKKTVLEGVIFGLGHGGIEALFIVGIPVLLQSHIMFGHAYFLSGVERLCAMTIHVCLSVIVVVGVKHRSFRFVIITILIHTCINFVIAYIATIYTPIVVELTLGILTALLLAFTIQLCRRKENNEKSIIDCM